MKLKAWHVAKARFWRSVLCMTSKPHLSFIGANEFLDTGLNSADQDAKFVECVRIPDENKV